MPSNVILREDEIANLDAKKLEQAKKRFIETSYQVTKDIAPVTGELSAYEYAMQDAQEIARAARKEPGYEDMTPGEALGRIGMVGLGVLGMIPVVGYGPKLLRKGIAELMPKRTPASTRMNPFDPLIREIRAGNQERIDSMTQSLGYQEYVRNLPEYRRTPERDRENIIEYLQLSTDERNQLVEAHMQRVDATLPPMRVTDTEQKATKQEIEQTVKNNEKNYEATVVKNSNALVSKNREPLTFGRGTTATSTGTVKDYVGSQAFDYVNEFGSDASAEQWLGFLKGARQKGVKAEELEDAGLLIFKGDEVIGGDLVDAVKKDPKTVFTKSEILSVLETNPTYRLKEKDYNFPLHSEEMLDVVPTLEIQGDELKRILSDTAFNIENVNARTPFNSLSKDISDMASDATRILSRYSASNLDTERLQRVLNKVDNILPQLSESDRLIARSYKEQLEKLQGLTKKGSEATTAPRHRSDFPKGGFDYREKVIYLDEPIPGNSSAKRVYSSHFNEPNPTVFVRYNTRGVDDYGDTLFIGEVQSDPHQNLRESFGTAKFEFDTKISNRDPLLVKRNNPYTDKLTKSIDKNKKKQISDQINALTTKHRIEPLSKSEFDKLMNLRKEYNVLDAKDRRGPVVSTEVPQSSRMDRGGSEFSLDKKIHDYMPMPKESTWTQFAVKSMVNEARKRGKRYVALSPADLYQMHANETKKQSLKIERFYGLSPRKLPGRGIEGEFLGGPEAMGKYRDYAKDLKNASSVSEAEIIGTGKVKGTADMVKAMEAVAKQIGAKTTIKRVYHTDPRKPYKVIDLGYRDIDDTITEIPSIAFKTKAERDAFMKYKDESQFATVDIKDVNDPRNFIESVVIDLQGAKKSPMKAYKLGGLVEVKREMFAPLF